MNGVTSQFNVRKPTWEDYILVEAPPWGPSSPDFNRQEQSIFDYRWQFVSLNTPARGQWFINSVTMYAYDAADAKDDDNCATVLESFVSTSSLWVAQFHIKKLSRLDHISLEKALNVTHYTTQCGVCTALRPSLSRQFRTHDYQLWYGRLQHNMHSDTLLATAVSRRGNRCAQIFATDFGWPPSFPMKLKGEAHEALSIFFQ